MRVREDGFVVSRCPGLGSTVVLTAAVITFRQSEKATVTVSHA